MEHDNTNLMLTIASEIRAARARKGWTQERLSSRSGVGRTSLSRIERCDTVPRVTTLKRIADALGVTVGSLVGE